MLNSTLRSWSGNDWYYTNRFTANTYLRSLIVVGLLFGGLYKVYQWYFNKDVLVDSKEILKGKHTLALPKLVEYKSSKRGFSWVGIERNIDYQDMFLLKKIGKNCRLIVDKKDPKPLSFHYNQGLLCKGYLKDQRLARERKEKIKAYCLELNKHINGRFFFQLVKLDKGTPDSRKLIILTGGKIDNIRSGIVQMTWIINMYRLLNEDRQDKVGFNVIVEDLEGIQRGLEWELNVLKDEEHVFKSYARGTSDAFACRSG